MSEDDFKSIIEKIEPINYDAYEKMQNHMNELAKPPGSLGELERISMRISAITGSQDTILDKRCVFVFAADNGVVEEGVASGPQSITASQTINMLNGITGVAVIAKHYKSNLWVTDVGINKKLYHKDLRERKIRMGTNNIAKQEAMTREEVLQAIGIGFETVKEASTNGFQVLGIGEMGIGNTTTSSAVLAALLGLNPEEVQLVIGRGAGLTDSSYEKKIEVIKKTLILHKPEQEDVIGILNKVGGFDLAAMAGAYLGAAYYKIPVVIDGFISIVAALCAVRINPLVKEYLFASHKSHEKGYMLAMEELELTPVLCLDMRLGEGSGCPIMFEVMETACTIARDMATFEQAEIDTAYLEDIMTKDAY